MRKRILIAGGATLAIAVALWIASLDRLDQLERTCRDELLKTARMQGTTDLRIEKHYDFWTKTISGGGFFMPWISQPYETPKVSLIVQFTREQRPRSAWIDCVFSKIPNSGEPPQIAFQEVKFSWENVVPARKDH